VLYKCIRVDGEETTKIFMNKIFPNTLEQKNNYVLTNCETIGTNYLTELNSEKAIYLLNKFFPKFLIKILINITFDSL